MTSGPLTSLLAALLLALALGACGSEDEGGGDGGGGAGAGDTPAARDAYLTRTNAICSDFNQRVNAAEEELFGPYGGRNAPQRVYSRFAKRMAPVLRNGFDEVRKVKPPKGEEAQVEEILDEADKGIRQMEKAARNTKQARPFYREAGPFARQNELANEYGMVECARQYNPRFDQ